MKGGSSGEGGPQIEAASPSRVRAGGLKVHQLPLTPPGATK